jgi:hypothetical protein
MELGSKAIGIDFFAFSVRRRLSPPPSLYSMFVQKLLSHPWRLAFHVQVIGAKDGLL